MRAKGSFPAGSSVASDGRGWTEEESRAAFDLMGDRFIDVTRRWLRSTRRQRLQHDVYTIRGVELSLTQIDALESIALGDIRMHELAEYLHIDPSTATRTVAPLVDLGLVEREMDPTNRRYVVLRCTSAGRTTASRIIQRRRKLMEDVLSSMDPRRRLLLTDLLEELLTLINGYQRGIGGPRPGRAAAARTLRNQRERVLTQPNAAAAFIGTDPRHGVPMKSPD